MITIGIDPGFSGAIACVAKDPPELIGILDMPLIKGSGKIKDEIDEHAFRTFIEDCLAFGPATVFLEKVSAMPGQGVTSMFRFGMAYGIARATAGGLGLPVHLITPRAWQAALVLPKVAGVENRKTASRQRAASLFPKDAQFFSRIKDSGRAEAALIAVAGQRLLRSGSA